MKWSEIEGQWWTIPSQRSKNGLAHRVWLSDPAVRILERLREKERTIAEAKKQQPSEWVFPGRRVGQPIKGVQSSQNRIRHATEIKDFQSHDIRRTCATKMASMGIAASTVDRVLNHVEKGVSGIYNRYSYDSEKRKALDAWSRRLMVIVSDLNEINSHSAASKT